MAILSRGLTPILLLPRGLGACSSMLRCAGATSYGLETRVAAAAATLTCALERERLLGAYGL